MASRCNNDCLIEINYDFRDEISLRSDCLRSDIDDLDCLMLVGETLIGDCEQGENLPPPIVETFDFMDGESFEFMDGEDFEFM